MLALYRCGRQAEALEAYKETRRHLVTSSGSIRARRCNDSSRRSCARTPRSSWQQNARRRGRPATGRADVPEAAAAVDPTAGDRP